MKTRGNFPARVGWIKGARAKRRFARKTRPAMAIIAVPIEYPPGTERLAAKKTIRPRLASIETKSGFRAGVSAVKALIEN
ncbi:MAG: hypothetical protein HoeaKO_45130 [Hoeflea alexandrii]